MLTDLNKTLKKMADYERQAPEAAELFKEIRRHLDEPLLTYCRQEALYRLEEAGYHTPSEELIEEATIALYSNDQFINSEIAENIIEDVIDYRGIHLIDILEEKEIVVDYTISSSYSVYHCIMPRNGTDLGSALKDTLSRILDMDGDEKDVQRIMGAIAPEIPKNAGEDWLKEQYPDGYLDLDLGYLIPGCILTMSKRVNDEAR
uniref:hypothetical protein n=1 Tax=Lachnoclostridium phocaeense TaxID=1871021 RepID=UPI0026DCA640|nr:hypothetical protein [Lachnoclostridium phocaeense]